MRKIWINVVREERTNWFEMYCMVEIMGLREKQQKGGNMNRKTQIEGWIHFLYNKSLNSVVARQFMSNVFRQNRWPWLSEASKENTVCNLKKDSSNSAFLSEYIEITALESRIQAEISFFSCLFHLFYLAHIWFGALSISTNGQIWQVGSILRDYNDTE